MTWVVFWVVTLFLAAELTQLVFLVIRPFRWEVRTAQLHTAWLAQLIEDGWEPFCVVAHEGDFDLVYLRLRTRAKQRPMSPEDAARFKEAQGA